MPQGHLNVMEAGENLLMHQKSLPVKSGQTAIKRGSVIVEMGGEWRLALTTDIAITDDSGEEDVPGSICYWSLQDQDQPDVKMAGKLTGVPCTFPMLLEVDQIKDSDGFAVGSFVQGGDDDGDPVVQGVIKLHVDDHTTIGVVKQTKTTRWSNDRLANTALGGAQRTGAIITCVQIWTLYIPNLSTAAPE